MNNKMNIKIGTVLAGILLAMFTGCEDAEYKPTSEGLYIAETETNALVAKKVMPSDDGNYTITFTPRMVQPATSDVEITLGLNASFVDAYNKRNGTALVALPEDFATFSEKKVTIKAGQTLAPTVTVHVKPLSEEMMTSGNKYALAVGMIEANGAPMLDSSASIIFQMEQLIIAPAPIINNRNNIHFKMRQDYALTEWSVEFLVNMDWLGTAIGEGNNQAMFAAFAPDGMEGEIYTRFGDAPIKGNLFQVKNQGTQFNSKTEFSTNKWYHIAIVCDGGKLYMYVNGELDKTLDIPGKVTNLSKDKFTFGNQDYLRANVGVSEVRFWTKAISQTQIKDNMFIINPQTEGLEAYFKLNEGSGNIFHDSTGHGNTGEAMGNTRWTEVRSDGK